MKGLIIISLLLIAKFSYAQISDSSIREIKLQGAINFRDIGGYKTIDGKQVKLGVLYRSAALNNLTDYDLSKLKKLNIKYDFDFRGPYEVKTAPDRIPTSTIRISLPAGSENIGDSAYNRNLRKLMSSDSLLMSFYRNLTPFKERYAPLFDSLVSNISGNPILFHCTAGKDRTGIAAALILLALGVDQETVLNDYVATNYYRREENKRAIESLVKYYQIDQNLAQNLMEAKREYLMATFDAIKSQFGSIQLFLNKELGLNKERISKLKSIYIENN